VVNLSMVKDVSQKVHEVVPGGLDVALGCGESAANPVAFFETILRYIPLTENLTSQRDEDAYARY